MQAVLKAQLTQHCPFRMVQVQEFTACQTFVASCFQKSHNSIRAAILKSYEGIKSQIDDGSRSELPQMEKNTETLSSQSDNNVTPEVTDGNNACRVGDASMQSDGTQRAVGSHTDKPDYKPRKNFVTPVRKILQSYFYGPKYLLSQSPRSYIPYSFIVATTPNTFHQILCTLMTIY